MIKFLEDKTVAGDRYGMGTIAQFDAAIERDLIADGSAIVCPIPTLIAQSYAGWSRSSFNGAGDTSYATLASVTLPAGTMNLNGRLEIIADWDYTNSVSNKTLAIDFGGTNVSAIPVTTTVEGLILIQVKNINSLSSQKIFNGSSFAVTSNARISVAINTGADVAIDFKCKWGAAAASESIALMGYSIYYYPGNF